MRYVLMVLFGCLSWGCATPGITTTPDSAAQLVANGGGAETDCCCPVFDARRFRVFRYTGGGGEEEIGTLTFQSWGSAGYVAEYRDPFGTPYRIEFRPGSEPCVWLWEDSSTPPNTGDVWCDESTCLWQWGEHDPPFDLGYLRGRGQ